MISLLQMRLMRALFATHTLKKETRTYKRATSGGRMHLAVGRSDGVMNAEAHVLEAQTTATHILRPPPRFPAISLYALDL